IAPLQGVLTSIGLIVPPLLLIALMARRRTLITQRRLARLRVVSLSLGNVAWALYFLRMGAWTLVPPVFWAGSVGVAVVGVIVGLRHVLQVPVEVGRWRCLHVLVFVVSVMCSLVIGGAGLGVMLIAWLGVVASGSSTCAFVLERQLGAVLQIELAQCVRD